VDLNEARDDGVFGWQWHQLDIMPTICTSLQTDNHTNTSSGWVLFLMLSHHCQSTEGSKIVIDSLVVHWLRRGDTHGTDVV